MFYTAGVRIEILTGYLFNVFGSRFTEDFASVKKHSPLSDIIIYLIQNKKMKYTV